MVSLAFIESITDVSEVEYLINLGHSIIADYKKTIPTNDRCLSNYTDNVLRNWAIFLPALEAKKKFLSSRKRRRCHGCEHDLCGQRDHMGGCLPDYDESWTETE